MIRQPLRHSAFYLLLSFVQNNQVNFLGPKNGGSVMLTRAYHSALSKSVRKHFSDSAGEKGQGGRIIHCMCHDSEILLQVRVRVRVFGPGFGSRFGAGGRS